MKIELDKITLVKQTEDAQTGKITEVRSVRNINIQQRRNIVEHRIPGLEGNIFQDMGRDPVRIAFEGTLQGKSARENLEILIGKFKSGKEVSFASDLTGASDVNYVLIEEFVIDDKGGVKDEYKYSVVLQEYRMPEEEVEEVEGQEDKAKEAVEKKVDDAYGSINYITGKVVDKQGSPKADVPVKIEWDKGEISIKTNEEGTYRKEELEPGKYIVTIDAKGYEGVKKEVVIKSAGEKAEIKEKGTEEGKEEVGKEEGSGTKEETDVEEDKGEVKEEKEDGDGLKEEQKETEKEEVEEKEEEEKKEEVKEKSEEEKKEEIEKEEGAGAKEETRIEEGKGEVKEEEELKEKQKETGKEEVKEEEEEKPKEEIEAKEGYDEKFEKLKDDKERYDEKLERARDLREQIGDKIEQVKEKKEYVEDKI